MSLKSVMNLRDSLNFIKSKFNIEYNNFTIDFANYKFINSGDVIYFKIDNYVMTNVTTIYNYDDFVESIKYIIKKSKITIVKSTVKVDSKTAMWELKVKK